MESKYLSFLVVGAGAIGGITAAILKKMAATLKLFVSMMIMPVVFRDMALR